MNEIDALVALARPARNIVAFTGAGISTESGIPDYRGPGGVWEKNTPPTIGDFLENPETRAAYWRERKERYHTLRDTLPNAGHLALTRLQDAGLLSTVITQNIDGLHQKSGIQPERVIELHGTAHRVRCIDCGASWPAEEIQRRLEEEPLPACEVCGGRLRGATILFGESSAAGRIAGGGAGLTRRGPDAGDRQFADRAAGGQAARDCRCLRREPGDHQQ